MKRAGWIVGIIVAALIGFFVRGLMPSGGGAPTGGAGGWGSMPPAAVKVVKTKLETASPVVEYIAHVEPVQQVMLQAQVEGVIDEVHFQEGSRVKQGDLLFTIDPAPFKASVAQRKAELEQANASLDRARKYLTMLNAAKESENRSVSRSDLDTAEANVAESQAMVDNAAAALMQADIDLGYTRITSPIDGRIGRALVTRGNLVSPSTGALANVIQIDPIRVVLAVSDSEYLTAFERYSSEQGYNPRVKVRLANGTVLQDEGEIDFDDNQMNPDTGTMAVRLRFPNPERFLVPNAYVTALVQDRDAPQRILLPIEAIVHDADGAFVWTVHEDNTVEPVRVVAGATIDERCIIESGLDSGVSVIVAGIQKVMPGGTVSPMEISN